MNTSVTTVYWSLLRGQTIFVRYDLTQHFHVSIAHFEANGKTNALAKGASPPGHVLAIPLL